MSSGQHPPPAPLYTPGGGGIGYGQQQQQQQQQPQSPTSRGPYQPNFNQPPPPQQQQQPYGGGSYFNPAAPAYQQQAAPYSPYSGSGTSPYYPQYAGAGFPRQQQQQPPPRVTAPYTPNGPHSNIHVLSGNLAPTTVSGGGGGFPAPPIQQQQQQQQQHRIQPTQTLSREAVADEALERAQQARLQQQYTAGGQQQQQQDLLSGGGGDGVPPLPGTTTATATAWAPVATLAGMAAEVAARLVAPRPPTSIPPREVEFLVGSPKYRLRTAVLFAAALFGMIPLLSLPAVTVLLCGCVTVYAADYLGHVRGTIIALLTTSFLFGLTLLLTNLHAAVHRLGPMLMVIDLTGVLLMATAACLLHFRWLQETYPELICSLERLVMAVTPVLALPSLLTTSIALSGSRYGPFTFLVAMCGLHYFFYGPLTSSFMAAAVSRKDLRYFVGSRHGAIRSSSGSNEAASTDGDGVVASGEALPSAFSEGATTTGSDGHGDEQRAALLPQQLNERADAALFTAALLLLPPLVYSTLQANWDDHTGANLLNALGLVCGACTYLCVDPMYSLWFLTMPREAALRAVERIRAKAAAKAKAASPSSSTAAAEKAAIPQAMAAAVALDPETVALVLSYDPLGLHLGIVAYREHILRAVGVVAIHWAAYRLTHSRYAFLFDGAPYPLNVLCLLVALFVSVMIGVELLGLLSADEAGKDVMRGQYMATRLRLIIGSVIVVVLFCMLSTVPGIFYMLGIMSVSSINIFLADRTNPGPMVSFTVFSALLLLWWMYRTFSFIVVDLRLLGGYGKVSTSLVAVSVLWSYILGCICFLFSFSKSKGALLVFTFLHAIEVTFVEEVLFAQQEDNAYPVALVLLTSAIGALLGYRYYKNGVLGLQGASFVASCYLAKILMLLVETTSAYYNYEAELDSYDNLGWRRAAAAACATVSWWAALAASFVVVLFELERRKRLAARAAARLPYLYLVAAVALVACTVLSIQRAVYEFITRSFVSLDELVHIAPGTALVTFAILTWPFFARQADRYPQLARLAALGKASAALGVWLLAVQPTRMLSSASAAGGGGGGGGQTYFEYGFVSADKGRFAALVGLVMLMAPRVAPLHRLPLVLRGLYWLLAAVNLAFGITAHLLPVPTFPIFACMVGFVFLMLLLVDLVHYRELFSIEGWVVYGLSFAVMLATLAMIARADLRTASRGNAALLWAMHEQGRLQFMSIVSVVNLFVAVVLRCRLEGRPLLPRCVPLTEGIVSQVSIVCNYATVFGVLVLALLNCWANESEPMLYVVVSLLLLMLVDDGMLFCDLHRRNYRYFPCVAFALGVLWICQFYSGWSVGAAAASSSLRSGGGGRRVAYCMFRAVRSAAFALPLLPAQLSLLTFLWDVHGGGSGSSRVKGGGGGGRRGGSTPLFVVGSTALALVDFVVTSSPVVTWMAIVCLCGQCARIFSHQLLLGPSVPPARRTAVAAAGAR